MNVLFMKVSPVIGCGLWCLKSSGQRGVVEALNFRCVGGRTHAGQGRREMLTVNSPGLSITLLNSYTPPSKVSAVHANPAPTS